jgi:hypothetical protein
MTPWKLLILVLVAVAACGGDTEPQPGYVVWRVDGVSCVGSDAIIFYIDGGNVGSETLAAGGAGSKPYPTSPGTHLIGAKEGNASGYTWPNKSVVISTGATYTTVLTC